MFCSTAQAFFIRSLIDDEKRFAALHLELGETLLQVFFVTLPDVKFAGAVEALEKQGRPVSAGIWKQCQKQTRFKKRELFTVPF